MAKKETIKDKEGECKRQIERYDPLLFPTRTDHDDWENDEHIAWKGHQSIGSTKRITQREDNQYQRKDGIVQRQTSPTTYKNKQGHKKTGEIERILQL